MKTAGTFGRKRDVVRKRLEAMSGNAAWERGIELNLATYQANYSQRTLQGGV